MNIRTIDKRRLRETAARRSTAFFSAAIRTILILGLSFVILYPFFTKVSMSLMETRDVYDMSVRYYPKNFTLYNYRVMLVVTDYFKTLLNTVGISALAGLLQTLSCTLTAYGLARYRFPGSKLLFVLVFVFMVVPPDVILAPLFLRFQYFDVFGLYHLITGRRGIGLTNTVWPFVLLGATAMGLKNGLYIFLMRQHFMGAPRELEEAAYVDGAGPYRGFLYIMLPGALSMMATVFLFSFLWQYLDGIYTTSFLPNTNTMISVMMSVGNINNLMESGISNVATATLIRYAGIVAMTVPLLIMYIACQKLFVESIDRSGLVG